jgi:hypothetical protein
MIPQSNKLSNFGNFKNLNRLSSLDFLDTIVKIFILITSISFLIEATIF